MLQHSPCENCKKRKIGCHSRCPDYPKWRAALRAVKIARRKETTYIDGYFSSLEKEQAHDKETKS